LPRIASTTETLTRQVTLQQIMRTEAQHVWDEFRKLPDGARY
jgi:hypothetical protein